VNATEDAEAALDLVGRVEASGPQSARVHRWLARALLAVALESEHPSERAVLAERVRRHAGFALERDPVGVHALVLQAASYTIEGEDVAVGLRAVSTASARVPGSAELRLVHARLLAGAGHWDAAHTIAASVLSRAPDIRVRREAKDLAVELGVTRSR
jgi:hypothetical protein